ncbi:MAG: DNA segregation ATPase FtsK/SpoIIIE, S-DNA-T family [Candidatus Peregrinibacteria bacterium Gr01-1014_25]|nr:MAG: DNA segregation ATPase FtsK/SpoIIIE, S-DNA-T family [Candidatus Peregrinibacteria bacterium Gr01-1014_25]
MPEETRRSISGVVQVTAAVLLFLALRNEAGIVGEQVHRGLVFLFGRWGSLFPAFLFASGILHLVTSTSRMQIKRSVGLLIMLFSFLGLMHVGAPLEEIGPRRNELAGAIGFLMSAPFHLVASRAVGFAVLGASFIIGIVLAFEANVAALVDLLRSWLAPSRATRRKKEDAISVEDLDESAADDAIADEDADLVEDDREAPELNIVRPAFAKANEEKASLAQSLMKKEAQKAVKEKLRRAGVLEMKDTRYEEWTFPSLELLDAAHSQLTVDDEQLKVQAKLIEEKLAEFGIDVTVRDARPGPTVTQFTLQPAEGVKLSKIASLKDDLSLTLAAQSLRIEAPIPGKSLVGIEMPNEIRTMVHLREILESPQFRKDSSSLAFPLGRDVSGEAVVASLGDMPHLLIAGATGSGKSVCMNVFLSALLYQNAPDDLKFILVDPKRVELMPYNGIPHLLTPVITDADKALQALRWAVAEMGRRLHRFSENGVRNIDEYNEKQTDDSTLLPRIVIVIDELADLMMRQYRRDTETMIVRIAQMARATGMHLIIATQRPSVDVITGLIKANIPTRIAFRVVSSVDSRTILDGIGAEDLLGKGDMLYMTASTPKPVRIQGIFISTKETERVINAVKIAGGGKITEQIGLAEDAEESDDGEESGGNGVPAHIDLEADDNGGDDLFFEAVKVVREAGKASASLLQRRLQVGYARAAKLLDIMEEKGLIGPAEGAKPRKIYMQSAAPVGSADEDMAG